MYVQVLDDFFDIVVGEIIIFVMQLQIFIGDFKGYVCDYEFCYGVMFGGVWGFLIQFSGGLVQEDVGGLEFGFKFGEVELQGLELVDGFVESFVFVYILYGCI